jgi:hypothetical protein
MGDRDIATVKAPRFPRRKPEPSPAVLDRKLWPHDYVGTNPALLGPCRIKQHWAGGYIIRSRRDGQLYTVPREHVQYYAKEASEA